MALSLITPPAVEPIDLTTAKLAGRVEINEDDTLVSLWITAARRAAEKYLRRALITQTWLYALDYLPGTPLGVPYARCLNLPLPPLQSVVSFNFTDTTGTPQTFSSANYTVDTFSEPGRICLNPTTVWPLTRVMLANAVQITYTCGYGNSGSAVPENIIAGMLLLVQHLYQHRSAVDEVAMSEIPLGVKYLWDQQDFGFYA